MKAYKYTGEVDTDGRLILSEKLKVSPGKVEVIILAEESIPKQTVVRADLFGKWKRWYTNKIQREVTRVLKNWGI
jgi:hypothetical protein